MKNPLCIFFLLIIWSLPTYSQEIRWDKLESFPSKLVKQGDTYLDFHYARNGRLFWGPMISTDEGDSWSVVGPVKYRYINMVDLGDLTFALAIEFPPANPDNIKVITHILRYSKTENTWVDVSRFNDQDFKFPLCEAGGMLFLNDYFGMRRSIDSGRSWQIIQRRSSSPDDFTSFNTYFMTRLGNALLAVFNDSLQRSYDSGMTWKSLRSTENVRYLTLGKRLLCLDDYNHQVTFTEDEGTTWAEPYASSHSFNKFMPDDTVCYAIRDTTLYISRDYCRNWERIAGGFSVSEVHEGKFLGQAAGGICISTAGSENWTIKSTLTGSRNNVRITAYPNKNFYIHDLLVDKDTIYTATNYGMFSTTNHGKTWLAYSKGTKMPDVRALTKAGPYIFARVGSEIVRYNNSKTSALYRSSDMGRTWTEMVDSQFVEKGLPQYSRNAMLTLISRSDTLFCLARIRDSIAVFSSLDFAQSWQRVSSFFNVEFYPKETEEIRSILVMAQGMIIVVCADRSSILVSLDNGQTWKHKIIDINGLTVDTPREIACSGSVVYLSGLHAGWLWRISDLPRFLLTDSLPAPYYINFLKDEFRPRNDMHVAASGNVAITGWENEIDVYGAIHTGGFSLSTDYGVTWGSVSVAPPNNNADWWAVSVLKLAISRGRVYAAFDSLGIFSADLSALMTTRVEEGASHAAGPLRISPSPSTGYALIHLDLAADSRVGIFVRNLFGQEVFSYSAYCSAGTNTVQVDLQSLPNGIYFVEYRSEGRLSATEKLILQK